MAALMASTDFCIDWLFFSPSRLTEPTIAAAIRLAIKPYSMAVAPISSHPKRFR